MSPVTVGMDRLAKENIFLLEFIVDRVTVDVLPKEDYKLMNSQICVGFSFLKHGPFYICEDSFIPLNEDCVGICSGCGNVKNGQSVLFPMVPILVKNCLKSFELSVDVFKKLPDYSIPDKVLVGSTKVPINLLFKQLLQDVVLTCAPICSKTFKQSFRVKDVNDDITGQIGLYIRLSCFGKIIVTKFQMDLSDDTIEYKAMDGNDMYKYKREKIEDICCPPEPECICTEENPKGTGDGQVKKPSSAPPKKRSQTPPPKRKKSDKKVPETKKPEKKSSKKRGSGGCGIGGDLVYFERNPSVCCKPCVPPPCCNPCPPCSPCVTYCNPCDIPDPCYCD